MKSLNLDIDWGSEPGSRCTATTVALPFKLSADLAVIYQGQDDSGYATFSYRVEVFDMADQYGQGAPLWTKRWGHYKTHLRAQLEATVALLTWFGKYPLGFDPDSEDGVCCRDGFIGRSAPASPPPAALEPVSDGGSCEWHNCYADAQADLNGRRFCGRHAEVMLAHYVSTSGDLGD